MVVCLARPWLDGTSQLGYTVHCSSRLQLSVDTRLSQEGLRRANRSRGFKTVGLHLGFYDVLEVELELPERPSRAWRAFYANAPFLVVPECVLEETSGALAVLGHPISILVFW